jgi:hypothetical protein
MRLSKPRIKTKTQLPYGGGFNLNSPEKGMVGFGTTFEMLMDRLRDYRHANGIPIGIGFEDEVEQEICARYPDACKETDSRIPPREITLSAGDVVRGTKVFAMQWANGRPTVEPEEAYRRARICVACPFQRSVPQGCGGRCGELKDFAKSMVGSKTTPYDGLLQSCGICHCWNSVSIWVPVETQWNVLNDQQKQQFQYAADNHGCWKIVR